MKKTILISAGAIVLACAAAFVVCSLLAVKNIVCIEVEDDLA